MPRRERWILVSLLGAALAALVVLAAALPLVRLEPGQPFPFDLFFRLGGSGGGGSSTMDLGWLGNLFLAILLFIAIFTIFSKDFRRWLIRTLPVYLLLSLVIYLLLMNIQPMEPPEQQQSFDPSAADPGQALPELQAPIAPPDFVTNPPDWLISLISVALAAGALWLAWRLTRRRPSAHVPVDQGADIAAEARVALQNLEAGADIRDTVTRCYVDMARILRTERGVTRAPDMTAREFEERLTRTGLGATHVRRLTRLFESVRYGAHAPGACEAQEAESCLRAIIEAYSAPR